jgi:hypothetical protein
MGRLLKLAMLVGAVGVSVAPSLASACEQWGRMEQGRHSSYRVEHRPERWGGREGRGERGERREFNRAPAHSRSER